MDLARFEELLLHDRRDYRCVRQRLGSHFRQTLKVLKVKCSVMLHAVAGGFLRDVGGHDNRRACA